MKETQTDFWQSRFQMNAQDAILYQWEQLEKTRCIDNFRIAAGLKEGFREGYFFADSDAYKWLDAASRILARNPSPRLKAIVDMFIGILAKAQEDDGYLYTYNQIHFGSSRWQNLQVEHEMYCMGHLIEAGVSHYKATGQTEMLVIVRRAADLLVDSFMSASPKFTDGHEEIEIALINLSRVTGDLRYRELAKKFLERRGRIPFYGIHFLVQTFRTGVRMARVAARRKKYLKSHPEAKPFTLPGHNQHVIPTLAPLRWVASAVRGKFTQQHTPLANQIEPVGHAVRFAYLNTAPAMIARDEGDQSDLPRLERLWEHMVSRRTYITGGIGALPLIEGFGRDFELDPYGAYAETCAALGCMLWSHEMNLLTHEPRFADLFEWQLFNAASVGIGVNGKSYFYNNPLACRTGLQRQGWYDIPCCPSNLSRMWASLHDQAVSTQEKVIFIDQFIPGTYNPESDVEFSMNSKIPWFGEVSLCFSKTPPGEVDLRLRIPAWAGTVRCLVNQIEVHECHLSTIKQEMESAVGLHFEVARYLQFRRHLHNGDVLTLLMDMPICLRHQDQRIKKCGGMTALSRGPLVYCMESIDNSADIFSAEIDTNLLEADFDPDLLGGTIKICGHSSGGEKYHFIPYMLWGNRGKSNMTVFFKTSGIC